MRIALVTDTHGGARGDSEAFENYFFKFWDSIFFPYLKENDITTVLHLGDLLDRRKFINFRTLSKFRKDFIYRLGKEGIDTHIIVGNHDTFYKGTNRVNGVTELFSSFDGKHEPWIYANPTEIVFDGLKILILPWINEGNRKETYDLIEHSDSQIIMGHLEVAGFEMYPGYASDNGIDASIFNKFDMVMSGHYHHKSDNGTIYYLGAPYEMTWSDYQDSRGFHIFDTDTRKLEYIKNPYRMFHKIFYDDADKTFEEMMNNDFSSYEKTYVKVVVQNKTNPYWFDIVLDNLYKANPTSVSIVEDFTKMNIDNDLALVDQAEDTMTILNKYIDSIELNGDKMMLQELLQDLYKDALTMDIK